MSWGDEQINSFLKIKVGDTVEFTVYKINEKQPTDKIKPLGQKGFYYEFETNKGSLIVNNQGLYWSLINAQVREGDRIRVKYLKKGFPGTVSLFDVEILEKGNIE